MALSFPASPVIGNTIVLGNRNYEFDGVKWISQALTIGGGGGTNDWNDLINVPATFPPTAHEHQYSEILNSPAGFPNIINVNQTSHGFVVNRLLRVDGAGNYVLSDNTSQTQAEVFGIVSAVQDANNFSLLFNGMVTTLSGLSPGQLYYLGSSGVPTLSPPTSIGSVSKPVYLAVSSTSAIFINMRGFVNSGEGSAFATFDNSNLSANVYTFNHNLGTQFPVIQVYNGSNVVVQPSSITDNGGNSSLINFGGAIAGTYKIRAIS